MNEFRGLLPGVRSWWAAKCCRKGSRPPGLSPRSLHRYFLIERGKNMCGLAACASYPIPQV